MRVALFDFDGTLVDSGPTVIGAARDALIQLGYPVPDDDTIQGFVGPPLLTGITQVLGVPAERAEEFRRTYRAIYADTMTQAQVYPGVADLLQRLTDDGWTLAVATSKREDLAITIAEATGIAGYFTAMAGADLTEQHADKSWVIGRALDLLKAEGVDPSAAIMVGDRRHDMAGATEQGLRAVFVAWGYGPISEAADAAAIAHDPTQLGGFLTELAT